MKCTIPTMFLLLFSSSVVFAQFENGWQCGLQETQQGKSSSGNNLNFIVPLPTYDGINFKTAVLYFKDADDVFDAGGDCRINSWPITSNGPNWMGELLIPTKFNAATVAADTAARPYSITTYFYQMSGGNIWIYGDEYAYPHTTVLNTPTNRTDWHDHNRIVHKWLIDTEDLSDLDNNGDTSVDMIIFLNRTGYRPTYQDIPLLFYQGVADGDYLPSPVDIAGASGEPKITGRYSVISNSGVYARNITDLLSMDVIAHEIGHQLRKSAAHLNGLHRWNLMSGSGSNPPTQSGLVMSAWERMELGWFNSTSIDTITTDELNYELADITASGQTVLIPVGTNYFLLELRRNTDRFEVRKNCGVSSSLPEGLLISYSKNNLAPNIKPADNIVATLPGGKKDGDATDLFHRVSQTVASLPPLRTVRASFPAYGSSTP